MLVITLLSLFTPVFSQVTDSYHRSSITNILLNYSETSTTNQIIDLFFKVPVDDKFYYNKVQTRSIDAPFSRLDLDANANSLAKASTWMAADIGSQVNQVNKNALLRKALMDKKLGNQILASWYQRDNDGILYMDLIHSRGRYGVTDTEVIESKQILRGEAMLLDYGDQLVENSHVLVYDFIKINPFKEAKGYEADVKVYLFRIDYNDSIRQDFYDLWIYDDDKPEIKLQKKEAFQLMNIPFILVDAIRIKASYTASDDEIRTRDINLLYELMVQVQYKALYNLTRKYEPFKVRTAIINEKPIEAKIGKKEGLKTDYRFFAYENVMKSDGTILPKKKGVLRAKNVVDNRISATGNMATTTFYQVAGRKIEPGYLLVQRNDFLMNVMLAYQSGAFNSPHVRIEYGLGPKLGIPGLYASVGLAYEQKNYNLSINNLGAYDYNFWFIEAGISKIFPVTRNVHLQITAYGAGESATFKDNEADEESNNYSSLFVKTAVELNVNIWHSGQIVLGTHYAYPFGKEVTDKNEVHIADNYLDLFPDRKGFSTLMGFRLRF
jgi:hypothetical protein